MRIFSSIPVTLLASHFESFLLCSQSLSKFHVYKPRILLVEDDPLLQYLHSLWLEKLGYAVTIVSSGEAVLNEVISDYVAVLMDVDLPGIDGITTTQVIFKNDAKLDVPIIACTTHTEAEIKRCCFEAGMVDYLQKPLSLKRLAQSLKKNLSEV